MRYGIYPAALGWDNTTQAYLNLRQLESVNFSPGAQLSQTIPGGAVDPAEHIVASFESTVEFVTRDLRSLLTASSTMLTTGFCLAHVGSNTEESYIVNQERADCGTFLTGSTHPAIKFRKGFLNVTSINAQQDDVDGAQVSLMLTPLLTSDSDVTAYNSRSFTYDRTFDLANDGLGVGDTPLFGSQYWLGPLQVNGVELPGVIGSRIEPGINFSTRNSSGSLAPNLGAIDRREPRLVITMLDIDGLAVRGFTSLLSNNIGVSIDQYLRRGMPSDGGQNEQTRYADSATEHVRLRFTASNITFESINVSGTEDVAVEMSIRGRAVAGSALSVALGVAIP